MNDLKPSLNVLNDIIIKADGRPILNLVSNLMDKHITMSKKDLLLGEMTIAMPEDIPLLLKYLASKLDDYWDGKMFERRKVIYP